jgi:hypothetical protein
MVKSNGAAISSSDNFQYELGVFASGFTPTAANTASWVANWKRLDAATYNEAASYFTSTFQLVPEPTGAMSGGNLLAVSTSPETSGYQVEEGSQLYTMVFNNTAMNETTELFLGTAGTWTTGPARDTQLEKPVNLRVSGITQPVFGGSNNTPSGGSSTPPPGSYQLQTATFLPIPEPSITALLGVLTAGAILRRRRER